MVLGASSLRVFCSTLSSCFHNAEGGRDRQWHWHDPGGDDYKLGVSVLFRRHMRL